MSRYSFLLTLVQVSNLSVLFFATNALDKLTLIVFVSVFQYPLTYASVIGVSYLDWFCTQSERNFMWEIVPESKNLLSGDFDFGSCMAVAVHVLPIGFSRFVSSFWFLDLSFKFFASLFRFFGFRCPIRNFPFSDCFGLLFGFRGLKKQSLIEWPDFRHNSHTFPSGFSRCSITYQTRSWPLGFLSEAPVYSFPFEVFSAKVLMVAVTDASLDTCIEATKKYQWKMVRQVFPKDWTCFNSPSSRSMCW